MVAKMENRISVLKKGSPNGQMVVYLRCRDFASVEEPIDGVVKVAARYLQHRKVFGQLIAQFRFGREEDEVMGLKFTREFVLASEQIYPPRSKEELTDMQMTVEKRLRTENEELYPFKFYFPNTAPATVSLFSKNTIDPKKACGIRYYLSIFVGDSERAIKRKRNSVDLKIRRIQYAPESPPRAGLQILISKSFIGCYGSIELEVTLDKRIFETDEKIQVNIGIQNYSTKKVKRMRVTLFQKISVQMLQNVQYKRTIDEKITSKACPIRPGASLQTVIIMVPKLPRNRLKNGVALDGNHRFAESDLASSTYLHHYPVKDAFGIIVNYCIQVKLYVGLLNTSIVAELPVVIMPYRKTIDEQPVEV